MHKAVASQRGIEPPAFPLGGGCSIRLSYWDIGRFWAWQIVWGRFWFVMRLGLLGAAALLNLLQVFSPLYGGEGVPG